VLVLTRSPGEAIKIGKAKLIVRRLRPTVGLVWSRDGLARDFNFTHEDVARQEEFSVDMVKVNLLGLRQAEIVLALTHRGTSLSFAANLGRSTSLK
jgi:hypothetical protein